MAIAICAILDGDVRATRARGNKLLRLAEEDGNLMARQTGLAVLAWLSIGNFDPEDALSKADEALQLSMTPLMGIQIVGLRGAALAQSGRGSEAFDVLHPARELLPKQNFITSLSTIESNYGL